MVKLTTVAYLEQTLDAVACPKNAMRTVIQWRIQTRWRVQAYKHMYTIDKGVFVGMAGSLDRSTRN